MYCLALALYSLHKEVCFLPPEYLMLDRSIDTGNNENSFQNGLVVFHPPWLFPYSFRTLLLCFLKWEGVPRAGDWAIFSGPAL